MPFRSLLLITLLLAGINAAAQTAMRVNPSNLLFYVDSTGDKEYMIPFIETSLKDMVFAADREKKLFSQVKNFNEILAVLQVERIFFQVYSFLDTERNPGTGLSNNSRIRDSVTSRILLSFDRFLKISIRRFEQLLEYQFVMYDVMPSDRSMPVLSEHLSSCVFIDPRSGNGKSDLLFALKQVCIESNQPPEIRFITNAVKWKEKYFLALGDTLSVEARVRDIDSPSERITVHWQQEPDVKGEIKSFLKIKPYDFIQNFQPRDTGNYILVASVSDGISRSAVDTFRFRVNTPPRIELRHNNYANLATVPVPMFQHYAFDREPRLVLQQYYELQYSLPPGANSRIVIRLTKPALQVIDSFANAEFRMLRSDSMRFKLWHYPAVKNTGSFEFSVQMLENGLPSNIGKMKFRYRNAWPVYFFASAGWLKTKAPFNTISYYFSPGFFLYFNRYARIEYTVGFPLLYGPEADSVPAGRFLLSHQFRVITPINEWMRFTNKNTALKKVLLSDMLEINAELGAGSIFWPAYSTESYATFDAGISIRFRYIWNILGTVYRFSYLHIDNTGVPSVPRRFFESSFGLCLLPVSGK